MAPIPAPANRSAYRVGLTGGIACGKSTVARLFADLGVPVIDTDDLARDVVAPGTPGLAAVTAAFGADLTLPDGTLDRARLRSVVFADPARRAALEAILHPLILARLEALSATRGGPYQLLVVPLLFESGLESRVDRVLVVDCSESVQRARLRQRDGETEAGIDRILAAQLDGKSRRDRADDLLRNDGDRAALEAGVRRLHASYLEAANRPAGTARQGGVKGAG
ncbi:MAG: dephospho-CoA kinase [Gammaproteobacteria bacterium]|nr:dephospho-CoA kinase [Gammaproteobacteria bacterium]